MTKKDVIFISKLLIQKDNMNDQATSIKHDMQSIDQLEYFPLLCVK